MYRPTSLSQLILSLSARSRRAYKLGLLLPLLVLGCKRSNTFPIEPSIALTQANFVQTDTDLVTDTPLHQAIRNQERLDYIKTLLKYIHTKNKRGETPLHLAASINDSKIIQILLVEKADIEANDNRRQTPLHMAADKGQLKAIQALVFANANINAREKIYDTTPLHKAVDKGHTQAIKFMIQAKANINATDNYGYTPLHYAAQNGKAEAINVLLKAKANIEVQDMNGNTPLHYLEILL